MCLEESVPCKVVIVIMCYGVVCVMSCVWKRVCPVMLLLSWLRLVCVMSCVWKRVCPVKLLLSCHVFGRECAL